MEGAAIGVANNGLQVLEKELVVGLKPLDFAAKTSTKITADQARGILKEMGVELPARINAKNIDEVLKNTPRFGKKQIDEFYKKASQIGNSN